VRAVRRRAGARRRWQALLAVVAVVVVLGLARPGADDASSAGSTTSRPEADRWTSSVLPSTTPPPSPVPESSEPRSTGDEVQVTEVIDGDTVKVSGGTRVRLIGIDTPERGQCGYREAGDALEALIAGRPVLLVPGARDDHDRYGRLLRYLDVDGLDLNLEMIRSGHAIARYDSRDGYGRHAREDAYVAADAASPRAAVCPEG
jgi:micrococcal nuclease